MVSPGFQGITGSRRFARPECYPCLRTPVTHVSSPYTAAKKVGAAPHRGEANRPIRQQGEANAVGKPPKRRAGKKTKTLNNNPRPPPPMPTNHQPPPAITKHPGDANSNPHPL